MKANDYEGRRNISGERVRMKRLSMRLSQAALAAKVQTEGVVLEQDAISRIELGDRMVQDYEARKTADLHQESLLEIMELTPTVNGPTDTCLHFLFENEGQFSLCTMNMDKAFLWDYQHEGSSVRGSREDIVEELGDFFYCQAATPEEVMM